MRLHREGKTFIPGTIIGVLIILAVAWWFLCCTVVWWLAAILSLLGAAAIGLILNFFRNPEFKINTDPNAVLAPCDGKVVVIEEVKELKYFNKNVLQISIFMSPLNVHVNRNPISGEVIYQEYFPGKYLFAFDPKSSTDNESNLVVIQNDKMAVGFKQIAGFLARRLCWYVKEGDQAEQGVEMGFIKFGSRIDVYLPVGTPVNVKLQDVVKGGRTVLAQIN